MNKFKHNFTALYSGWDMNFKMWDAAWCMSLLTFGKTRWQDTSVKIEQTTISWVPLERSFMASLYWATTISVSPWLSFISSNYKIQHFRFKMESKAMPSSLFRENLKEYKNCMWSNLTQCGIIMFCGISVLVDKF